VPEGDTIHRAAARLSAALGGRVIELAEAPDPRSPLHHRAGEIAGRSVQRVEAYGKHLLIELSGGLVVHSHLGINGRWVIRADGSRPRGRPWLALGSGRAIAAQFRGKVLRLVSSARARSDPMLAQLGPDPLGPGFEVSAAARRLRELGAGRELGDALLDQRLIAGIGNAIRNEALFARGLSPWRPVDGLGADEAERLVAECRRIMQVAVARGRRPKTLPSSSRALCPRCGGRVRSRGQGDANRTAYWCPRCQP
jgi:endonuclease-8